MGEVKRPRVVKVKAGAKGDLVAAAAKACAQHTSEPTTERVLVVYGPQAANLYIESTPPPGRPAVQRRAS